MRVRSTERTLPVSSSLARTVTGWKASSSRSAGTAGTSTGRRRAAGRPAAVSPAVARWRAAPQARSAEPASPGGSASKRKAGGTPLARATARIFS